MEKFQVNNANRWSYQKGSTYEENLRMEYLCQLTDIMREVMSADDDEIDFDFNEVMNKIKSLKNTGDK